MAKRFIDTGFFSDSWVLDLSMEEKLFVVYLYTNCDHAGIIDLNLRLAEFQTGIEELVKNYPTLSKQLKGRLVHLYDNYHFLPKFIKYQYPKGLSYNVKAQKSVIERLQAFKLYDEKNQTVKKDFGNSYQTVQDKDMDKDIDKEKDKDKDKDKDKTKSEIETENPEIILPFDSEVFKNKWELWKDYRKEIKKPIKGVISEQAALKDLSEMANLNENTAIQIINQSMSKNWQGLFELKSINNENPNELADYAQEIKQRVINRHSAESTAD